MTNQFFLQYFIAVIVQFRRNSDKIVILNNMKIIVYRMCNMPWQGKWPAHYSNIISLIISVIETTVDSWHIMHNQSIYLGNRTELLWVQFYTDINRESIIFKKNLLINIFHSTKIIVTIFTYFSIYFWKFTE